MHVQPYLFFEGRAEEAAHFYQQAIGAEVVMLMTYDQSPEPAKPGMLPPGSEKKIMHMHLKIGESALMGSDGMCHGSAAFKGFALSLISKTAAEAEKNFAALSVDGQVQMPLTTTFYSQRFGMVADKFGVSWMILVEQ